MNLIIHSPKKIIKDLIIKDILSYSQNIEQNYLLLIQMFHY